MKYQCSTCGATMDAPGRYVIAARGYYWHLPCTTMQSGMVGFPSGGMLIPASILHRDENGEDAMKINSSDARPIRLLLIHAETALANAATIAGNAGNPKFANRIDAQRKLILALHDDLMKLISKEEVTPE